MTSLPSTAGDFNLLVVAYILRHFVSLPHLMSSKILTVPSTVDTRILWLCFSPAAEMGWSTLPVVLVGNTCVFVDAFFPF
jgi:hypothetical protein